MNDEDYQEAQEELQQNIFRIEQSYSHDKEQIVFELLLESLVPKTINDYLQSRICAATAISYTRLKVFK